MANRDDLIIEADQWKMFPLLFSYIFHSPLDAFESLSTYYVALFVFMYVFKHIRARKQQNRIT